MFNFRFVGDAAKCGGWVGFAKQKAVEFDRLLSKGLYKNFAIGSGGFIRIHKVGNIYHCTISMQGSYGYEFFCLWDWFRNHGDFALVRLNRKGSRLDPENPFITSTSQTLDENTVFPRGRAKSLLTGYEELPSTVNTTFHPFTLAQDPDGGVRFVATRVQIPEWSLSRHELLMDNLGTVLARHEGWLEPVPNTQVDPFTETDRADHVARYHNIQQLAVRWTHYSRSPEEAFGAGTRSVGRRAPFKNPASEALAKKPEDFDPEAQPLYVPGNGVGTTLVLVERTLKNKTLRFYVPSSGQVVELALPAWVTTELYEAEQPKSSITKDINWRGYVDRYTAGKDDPKVLWESNPTGSLICCAVGPKVQGVYGSSELRYAAEPLRVGGFRYSSMYGPIYPTYNSWTHGYLEYQLSFSEDDEVRELRVHLGRNARDHRHVAYVGYPWDDPYKLHVVKPRYLIKPYMYRHNADAMFNEFYKPPVNAGFSKSQLGVAPGFAALAVLNEIIPVDSDGSELAALRSELVSHSIVADPVSAYRVSSHRDAWAASTGESYQGPVYTVEDFVYRAFYHSAGHRVSFGEQNVVRNFIWNPPGMKPQTTSKIGPASLSCIWGPTPDRPTGYVSFTGRVNASMASRYTLVYNNGYMIPTEEMGRKHGYISFHRKIVACDLRSGSIAYRRKDDLPYRQRDLRVPRKESWYQAQQKSIEYHKGIDGPLTRVGPELFTETPLKTETELRAEGYSDFGADHPLWMSFVVNYPEAGLMEVLDNCYKRDGAPYIGVLIQMAELGGTDWFENADVMSRYHNDWGFISSSPAGDWAMYVPRPTFSFGTKPGLYHPDADVIDFSVIDDSGEETVATTSHEEMVDRLWPKLKEHENYVPFKLSIYGLLASSGVWGRIDAKS